MTRKDAGMTRQRRASPGTKGGRSSSYTAARARAICVEIANGRCLREICAIKGMPSLRTVFTWLALHDEFRTMYAAAREAQADYLAEELLEIADDATNDWMQRRREDGTIATVLNGEHVQRSRLRIDTRKFLLAKFQPKKYGDRVVKALELVGRAFDDVVAQGFARPVLVGGGAVEYYTAGAITSGDLDVVTPRDGALRTALLAQGFLPENRPGYVMGGYYHPELSLVVEVVGRVLMEGAADPSRVAIVKVSEGSSVAVIDGGPYSRPAWPILLGATRCCTPRSASGTRVRARMPKPAPVDITDHPIRLMPSGRASSPDITLDEALFCLIQGPTPESEPAYQLVRLARLEPKVGFWHDLRAYGGAPSADSD